MKRCLVFVILLFVPSAADAWNNKGHMTVARLAWNELSADERGKIVAILRSHPHIDEFLRADRPANFLEDEWIFLRAATWADWVRNHHQAEFSKPDRHFIDLPFVVPGSGITPPALKEENAVNGIKEQKKIASNAGDRTMRGIAVTWLFHLLGDIHQPLHTVTRYSNNFPTGDRGGNLAMVRVHGGSVVQLHPMWDGLLGTSTTRSSILGTVAEVDSLAADNSEVIAADLTAHTTADEWAKESFALAVKVAYEDGNLHPANVDDHPESSEIPDTKANYAENAGKTARLCAAKGGKRLAQLLKEVLANN